MPIIEATFVAASSRDHRLSETIESAMQLAVEQALAEGISDPEAIKSRILAAREAVKDHYYGVK